MPDWRKITFALNIMSQWREYNGCIPSDLTDICGLLIVARNHCKYISARMAQIYD